MNTLSLVVEDIILDYKTDLDVTSDVTTKFTKCINQLKKLKIDIQDGSTEIETTEEIFVNYKPSKMLGFDFDNFPEYYLTKPLFSKGFHNVGYYGIIPIYFGIVHKYDAPQHFTIIGENKHTGFNRNEDFV